MPEIPRTIYKFCLFTLQGVPSGPCPPIMTPPQSPPQPNQAAAEALTPPQTPPGQQFVPQPMPPGGQQCPPGGASAPPPGGVVPQGMPSQGSTTPR